jgi:hypothetical protein
MQPVVSTYISSDNELTGPFCIVISAIPTSGISFVSTSLSEIDGDPVDDTARFRSIVMDLYGIRNLDMVVIRRPNKRLVVVAVLNNIFPPFRSNADFAKLPVSSYSKYNRCIYETKPKNNTRQKNFIMR